MLCALPKTHPQDISLPGLRHLPMVQPERTERSTPYPPYTSVPNETQNLHTKTLSRVAWCRGVANEGTAFTISHV